MTEQIPKWKRFEMIVADIQRDLAPGAVVTQNDKVRGRNSDQLREIDISIRQKIGQFELFVAIDCKDYDRVIHVKDVETFAGLLDDIGANKGAIVSAKRYSKAAIRLAKRKGIDLYRLVDTGSFEWASYLTMPTLVKNLRLKWRAVFSGRREDLEGTAVGHSDKMWREGKMPDTPGEYRGIQLDVPAQYARIDDALVPAHVSIDAQVWCDWYFGHLSLTSFRGLTNEIDGSLKANDFITDWLPWVEIEQKWQKLASPADLSVKPMLTFFFKDAPIGDSTATHSVRLLVSSKMS